MVFDPSVYGAEVARILALGEGGQRLAPLVCGPCASEEARRELSRVKPAALFPKHKEPEAPMAGLWLYFSCFEEAHRLIDDARTPDGVSARARRLGHRTCARRGHHRHRCRINAALRDRA